MLFDSLQVLPKTVTTFSLSLSRADVASSKIRIGGFFKNTRAMDSLCFCPPKVSLLAVRYPYHNHPEAMINSWALALLAARMTSSSVALGLPYRIFSMIVPANK